LSALGTENDVFCSKEGWGKVIQTFGLRLEDIWDVFTAKGEHFGKILDFNYKSNSVFFA
jgi:hypothetical protein